MKKIPEFLILAALLLPQRANALSLLSCTSDLGKRITANFGQWFESGMPGRYIPLDVIILGIPTPPSKLSQNLQDHIFFDDPAVAAETTTVQADSGKVIFKLTAKGMNGQPEQESLDLWLVDPRDSSGFIGTWTTLQGGNSVPDTAYCTIF